MKTSTVPSKLKEKFQLVKLYLSFDVWIFYKLAFRNMNYMDEKVKLILNTRSIDRNSSSNNRGSNISTTNPMFNNNNSNHDNNHDLEASKESISSTAIRLTQQLQISKVCMDKLNQSEIVKFKHIDCPTYHTLSCWVYDELLVKYEVGDNWFKKKLVSILSYTIFGHLVTNIGRYSWLVSAWKIGVLFTVSIGYWNDYLLDVFRADSTINNMLEHVKGTDEAETLLQGILSIRTILYQLIPPFVVLSLYVQDTASCPIFISKSSKIYTILPPLFLSWYDARKIASEEELMHQEWVLFLLTLHHFVCGGRLIKYLVGALKNVMAMSVIFLSVYNNDSSIESINMIVIISSIIIVPYIFFYTLKYLVLLGKSPLFHMTDTDFQDFYFVAEYISKLFGRSDHHEDDDIDNDDIKKVDTRITLTHITNSSRIDDDMSATRLDDSISSTRIEDYNNDKGNNIITNIIHKSNKFIDQTVSSLHDIELSDNSNSNSNTSNSNSNSNNKTRYV